MITFNLNITNTLLFMHLFSVFVWLLATIAIFIREKLSDIFLESDRKLEFFQFQNKIRVIIILAILGVLFSGSMLIDFPFSDTILILGLI